MRFADNDSIVYEIGAHCSKRTQLYHELHHFKYHLMIEIKMSLKQKRLQYQIDNNNQSILFYI